MFWTSAVVLLSFRRSFSLLIRLGIIAQRCPQADCCRLQMARCGTDARRRRTFGVRGRKDSRPARTLLFRLGRAGGRLGGRCGTGGKTENSGTPTWLPAISDEAVYPIGSIGAIPCTLGTRTCHVTDVGKGETDIRMRTVTFIQANVMIIGILDAGKTWKPISGHSIAISSRWEE